jgi:glucose-1-phosphate cytidylyltransferase
MKAVILAGGYGTRISEESGVRPKPMVEIGGKPILWHIMKIYSAYGINEFIVCCGYKGFVIVDYFTRYLQHHSDLTVDLRTDQVEVHRSSAEPWRVTLIDTGEATMTGGRLKRVIDRVGDDSFCFTYGDGVSDIRIDDLVRFHKQSKTLATLTAVQMPGRFGSFTLGHNDSRIHAFREKPREDGSWINGGYFVLEPKVADFIKSDSTVWEREPMEELARSGQLSAYRHDGFWHPMDTLRDKHVLEDLWTSGKAPWKVWDSRQAA